MRENTDQKNLEYGHFSLSDSKVKKVVEKNAVMLEGQLAGLIIF